jgi:hypothetical protein
MPHAWGDINTTAFFAVRCDPIWRTCDIRATVRVQMTKI